MPFYERQEKILNALLEKDTMPIQELSKKLYVSMPTLRRDLIKLEQMGKIVRTHGGARLLKTPGDKQIPLLLREQEGSSAKAVMGQKAAHLVKDGDIIMLDASTSAYNVIPYLSGFNNLIVITSSAKAALLLGQMGITTICTGGRMITHSFAFIGDDAEHTARSYNADILFFSCRGVSMDGRLTDKSVEENALRKVMMGQCAKKVLLCDSSKLGHTFLNTLCHLREVDDMICEAPIPEALSQFLHK